MKKISLGEMIQVVANLAVIGGIVFLAFQLRQNNDLMAAQQRFNRLTVFDGSSSLVADNAGLAEVLAKAENGDVEQLSPGERRQVEGFLERILYNQQWSFNELPRDELPIKQWRRVSRQVSWQFYWKELKGELKPDFVHWMEANVIGK
jgi:hypothetical protein